MAILATIEGVWAHYRSAWTNHSNALTYPAPPRSALLGMVGAALGLPCEELADRWEPDINDPILQMGFMWDTSTVETVTQVRRYKIEGKGDITEKFLRSDQYTKNQTVDSLSYLHHPDIPARLRGKWLIIVSDEAREKELYQGLLHPVYPLSFGSSEALARIVTLVQTQADKITGSITTMSSVPVSQEETLYRQDAIPSVMARSYKEYGKWLDYTRVWTPIENNPIQNVEPKYGAYQVEGEIYAIL